MDAGDVEVVEREICYRGIFQMERMRMRYRRFDGGWTRVLNRELFVRGTAVAVLPYDPVRDEIVLIEQFRCAAYAAGRHPWMIEIVAGMTDHNEPPEEVARRETAEETGLSLQALEPIAELMPSPGALVESVAIYCGRVDAAQAHGLHGLAAEDEDIRVFTMPAEQALALVAERRIDTSTTLVALQWLALNRASLRARWLAESAG